MSKKKLVSRIGLCVGALALVMIVGYSGSAFSDSNSKYLDKEYSVKESIQSSFDLDNQGLKPIYLRDLFDDSIATESDEVRSKLISCYKMLRQEKEITQGDFKPIFYLDGKEKVFIGVLHPNDSITLTEFDILKDKPEKIDKKVKEAAK